MTVMLDGRLARYIGDYRPLSYSRLPMYVAGWLGCWFLNGIMERWMSGSWKGGCLDHGKVDECGDGSWKSKSIEKWVE